MEEGVYCPLKIIWRASKGRINLKLQNRPYPSLRDQGEKPSIQPFSPSLDKSKPRRKFEMMFEMPWGGIERLGLRIWMTIGKIALVLHWRSRAKFPNVPIYLAFRDNLLFPTLEGEWRMMFYALRVIWSWGDQEFVQRTQKRSCPSLKDHGDFCKINNFPLRLG